MKPKKLFSAIVAVVMSFSTFAQLTVVKAAESEVYTCDFTQLVKDGADTAYGASTDVYELDEYTTAYLTYEGTYVTSDAKVYLKSGTIVNGAGKYSKGSYIAFTAPSNGTVEIKGADIGICINDGTSETYKGYGATNTYEVTAGSIVYAGYRKPSTYVSSITFTAAPEPTPTPTPDPNATQAPSYDDDIEREVVYQENFETYSDGDEGGWTTPAGKLAIKTDSNSLINKYLTVTSGKSGTARSGYKEISAVSDNFVLEADIKTTAYQSNVSAFEVLEQKGSLYMNHGCYSNGKYIFKMNRPSGLNRYVINNAISDSGMSLDRYEQPVVVTKDIPDEWLHIKVIGNYDDHTSTAYITSLDRTTVYYHGRTDMSSDISSFKLLALLAPSSGVDTCIDNIKISKAVESDLSEVFYTVKINDGIEEFSQYVYTGEAVTNIPDISVYGKHFLGWDVNGKLYTSEELASLAITADTNITASISADYIENISSVEFNSFPTGNMLTMGPDGDTYADNEISLTITGERGTSIVANPDSRVTDYKIDWKLDGFRTLDGTPTGESGSAYCDSYGNLEIASENQTSVNFRLKNTSANYYGIVTATVTYNGKTLSVSSPLLLLADTSRDDGVILPLAGYVSDYNKYESSVVGYKCLVSSDNGSGSDTLLGGWATAGSCGSRKVELAEDETGKFLRLSREGTSGSAVAFNKIGNTGGQTIFSQDIRFSQSGSIIYKNGSSSATTDSSAFTLAFDGSAFKFNGTQIATGTKNTWYHVEICADTTTQLCSAKIYDMSGTLLGESETVSFETNVSSLVFYTIKTSSVVSSIDFNNVKISNCKTDATSFNVTKSAETVNIPTDGIATIDLSVSAKTVEGYDATGIAEWEIDDEFAEGIGVTADSADSHKAVLTVESGASSGEIPVKVTIGGVSHTTIVKVIGENDNVAFTVAATGAYIPESGSLAYKYEAEVRNGNAETVGDRAITYELYNSDGIAELTAEGISISEEGVLTVTSSATPQMICVKASSTDENGNVISKLIRVSIYSYRFSFGATEMSGTTQVSADTQYSENRGYGITGTGVDNEGYISGNGTGFKVKVESGNVYSVKVTYEGTIRCEYINSSLTGFERTKESLGEDSFNVAVFDDGILDITLYGEGKIASVEFAKVEREAAEKPSWWTIGDSTVQQNGSWAYQLVNSVSDYPKLEEVIDTFYNSGRAGRQHRSYYSEGLFNSVLTQLKPGDVVSISGMGTNDSSSDKEDFKWYTNIYINAIEDMGGYVILGSYTPTGNYGATEGKVYDADNVLFKGMRTNSYDVAIREVYAERVAKGDEKVIGFIDIGKISDNLMTNDVRTEYNKAADAGKSITEARAAANTKAEEMMAWWKDYNHYYSSFSNYILPEITTRAAQLISGEEQSAIPEVIELHEAYVPESVITVLEKTYDADSLNIKIDAGFKGVAIGAMYDESGVLRDTQTKTQSTSAQTFEFDIPQNKGYTIRIMNWDSLEKMKPYKGTQQTISVDDIITDLPGIVDTTGFEITSSDEYIDVSSLVMYGNTTYRIYSSNGYTDTTANNGKVHNTTGGEVTVVPVYRFEFTNTASSTDEHINGYVKVVQGSYSEETGYGLTSDEYNINENGCRPVNGTPIKVDVPDGFYDFTVYRKGGVRADLYNNGIQIANNTTSSGSQNRPAGSAVMSAPRMRVTDGISLTFGNTQGSNERIASVEVVRVPNEYKKPVIWVAGDSESANYYPIDAEGSDLDSSKIMMTGFGMQIDKFLSDDYVIANYGQPSATVKTWYNECFESVNTLMQRGDTILIDFGINEVASSSNGIGIDEMKQYMQTIIEAAKDKGVTTVIVSPVYNGKYQHKAYFTYSTASKENAMTDFAREMGVECIDLNKYTQLYVNEAIEVTGDENWSVNNYHVADNLHLTQHSALLAASFIAAELKGMGYATTDYAYTYKDISSVNTDGYTRGDESGITRVYSVSEAEKFIEANTEAEPISVKEWDFDTDQTATSGDNIPVLSGNVEYDSTNQNIKFNANSTASGTLAINLNPVVSNNVTVGFDLKVGALGGQSFGYSIVDNEGNNLVSCNFDDYNETGSLTIGNTVVATNDGFTDVISSARGDGMTADTTSFANEIDFDTNTVTVNINSTVFTGKLTGAETKTVAGVSFTGARSKSADRSIYMDNISIKEYKMTGETSGETAFPEFETATYQKDDGKEKLSYRIYNPESENIPVVVYLHGETRKGSDNESQLYNSQYLFNEIKETDTECVLVAPQCPSDTSWSDMADAVIGIIGDIPNADTDRIYIAGYGEGADACYELLATGVFAAALPVSGVGDASFVQQIVDNNSAVMAFNGSEETENSREIIKSLVSNGSGNAEYVEFYGEGSNIQKTVPTKAGVLDWLFSKSISSNAVTAQKTVDLAIFMGQSNMAGRGSYADATDVPVGHGYEFRSITQPDMLFNITGPFGKLENNSAVNDNSGSGVDRRSGDMVSSIMESYYQATGTPIVGVQCSRGGTNTGYWIGSTVKAEAQARLTAAKTYLEENGYKIGHVFMVWCQGESDGDKLYSGSQSIEAYKSNTLSVFGYMQEVGVTDMFIVQTGHYNGSDDTEGTHDAAYVSVNEAQAAMAEENDNVYTVASFLDYKDNMIDSYHFNQSAYNAVGTTAGANIAEVYAD